MTYLSYFLEQVGRIYRVLLEQEDGGLWLISYSSSEAPFLVASENLHQFRRIPTPEGYLQATSQAQQLTPAQVERLALIQPLLDDAKCVTDKATRQIVAAKTAAEHGTTPRRLLRLYYRYLATGVLTESKQKAPQKREDYDWAIRTYYYSAKKFSLRATYDMMLVQRYSDPGGQLQADTPTWSSFQHYFYSRGYHKQTQKVISREGLSHYQRNCHPTFGSASGWRSQPGSYQMDATQADIYLVSRLDRSMVIGRPYIYMAVDTATQLIAGIYVGLEAGEGAVMQCLENAAIDKMKFCWEYSMTITPEQWPSKGLPHEIITDKGREFLGGRMEELCRRYGIEVQSLPPFRPDRKGLVEKAFDLLQQRYKPLLRGKGVIEPDAQERWATDYRSQATLDLQEFTQIILHCVIYLNSGRMLTSGKTPAQTWIETRPQMDLLPIDYHNFHPLALPRVKVKYTRNGFKLHGLYYIPEMGCPCVGDTYTLAYDPANVSYVRLIDGDNYHICSLAASCQGYGGYTAMEVEAMRTERRCRSKEARKNEIMASTAAIRGIQEVVQGAQGKDGTPNKKQTGDGIQENREAERGRLS